MSPTLRRAVFETVVLELVFGEGGTDSKLFVYDLFDAYAKYARSLGFELEVLGRDDGHITAKISGKNVWVSFKHEIGKHVLQRTPITENRGRHHTSVVVVGVLPLPPESESKSIPIDEFKITTQCGSGPGGQHRNKTASAVRIVHKTTGITVYLNGGRDQSANKKEAIRIITTRVNDFYNNRDQAEYDVTRRSQLGDTGRGNKVRTYNLIKNRIVDHRLDIKTANVKDVLERGNFSIFYKNNA